MWHAQGKQDEWVVDMLGPSPGYFVDVGAYDGVQTSNTYALEQLGWDGVCIEASPAIAAACASNRRCRTVALAVAERSGWVWMLGDRIVDHGGVQVPAGTLTEILDSVNAPAVLDYLSLDIEGGELIALRSLDWSRYSFRVATIETNVYADGPAHKDAIFEFMSELGYVRVVEDAVVTDTTHPQYVGVPYEDWYAAANFKA